MFLAEDPEILGVSVQNLVAWASWHPGFVYLRYKDQEHRPKFVCFVCTLLLASTAEMNCLKYAI